MLFQIQLTVEAPWFQCRERVIFTERRRAAQFDGLNLTTSATSDVRLEICSL